MGKNGSALTELAMVGWINADLAYQGIKAAGPDFDRQKVIDATNQMTDYTAGGLIAADRLVPPARGAHAGRPGDARSRAGLPTRWSRSRTGRSRWSATRPSRGSAGPARHRDWSEPTPTNFP